MTSTSKYLKCTKITLVLQHNTPQSVHLYFNKQYYINIDCHRFNTCLNAAWLVNKQKSVTVRQNC